MIPLEIIYEDDNIVVINKPHGLIVHRSKMAKDVKVFAMQLLRNQIGQKVFPAHRLDRKTSGVLIFTKNVEYDRIVQAHFRERTIEKKYLALVRGFTEKEGIIDYPLTDNKNKLQEAKSHYKTLQQFEIPLPFGSFESSRYSLIELRPETGRFHQLRKHMAHIMHPIIGDRPHGCNKQNKLWKGTFELDQMLLHAQSLSFTESGNSDEKNINYSFEAPLSAAFSKALHILKHYPNH